MSEIAESSKSLPCRHVAMLVFEGCEVLDACGPLDVFAFANHWFRFSGQSTTPIYRLSILAEHAGAVTTNSGIRIVADHGIDDAIDAIDTLLIAGSTDIDPARNNVRIVDWVRNMAPAVRRIGSICTGAFVLAEAGILDGRRATTHWLYCRRLADEFPSITLEADRLYVQDGPVYCSGGVTAGIDLALHLVEEDCGHDAATMVARGMLMFPKRPGGQTQFSSFLLGESTTRPDIRSLQDWIVANPQADLGIAALAERMCMSPRHFSRIFDQEVGMPPAKFVELTRLNNASVQLEQTLLPLESIAERCGFGSAENMRRSFQKIMKISPQTYRARFRSEGRDKGTTENQGRGESAYTP